MYADKITASMELAIDETNRRREIQVAYNTAHGIDPTPLRKKIGDITDMLAREDADTSTLLAQTGGRKGRRAPTTIGQHTASLADRPAGELAELITELSDQMHACAAALQFEVAARLRDEISELKKELRGMIAAEV